MTSHIWIGGAPANAQIKTITIPSDIEPGQVVNATIGVVKFTYTVPEGATFTNAISGLVNAWNTSVIPAATEIFAVAEFTVETDPVPTGVINLNARTPGVPFIVNFTMGDGGNEIQVVTLSGTITGGTYTLTFDGQTTGNISHNASAATVQTELRALSNIGVGDVVVTGSDGGPYTVEFQGTLASADVDLITANFANLIGTNEQQTITLATGASGGTFTLTYGGATTAALAYNISAANLELALEGLSGVGSGNVSISGSGPWTVTFQNSLGKTDVGLITIIDSGILGGLNATVAPTTDGGGAINERFMISAVEGSGFDANFRLNGNASVTAGTFTLKVVAGGKPTMRLITLVQIQIKLSRDQEIS